MHGKRALLPSNKHQKHPFPGVTCRGAELGGSRGAQLLHSLTGWDKKTQHVTPGGNTSVMTSKPRS